MNASDLSAFRAKALADPAAVEDLERELARFRNYALWNWLAFRISDGGIGYLDSDLPAQAAYFATLPAGLRDRIDLLCASREGWAYDGYGGQCFFSTSGLDAENVELVAAVTAELEKCVAAKPVVFQRAEWRDAL